MEKKKTDTCEENCDCGNGVVTQEFLDEYCKFVNGEWVMKDEHP